MTDLGATAEPVESPARPVDLAVVRHGRLWLVYVLVGVVVIIGHGLLPPGIPKDMIYCGIGLSGAAAIVCGVRIHQPTRVAAWYLMAAGQGLWALADVIGSYTADVLGVDGFPTPADPVYLLGYPVLAVACYLLTRRRQGSIDWAGLLDSAILTAGLGLLAWVVLAAPTLEQYGESPSAAAIAVAYPVGDIVLMAVLIRLLTAPGGRVTAMRLLLIALAFLIVADVTSTALGTLTVISARPLDPLWLLSYLAWGASALHPSMYSLSASTPGVDIGLSRSRFVALAVAVMVAPGTLAAQQILGIHWTEWPIIVGSVVSFALVMARMNLAMHQILTVDRQREQLRADLVHQAAHDSLTDLPNRVQFRLMLRGALARTARTGGMVGLLHLDLGGFKAINDTLGNGAGDEVLRTVARRLKEVVRDGDVVARFGGDEFVVMMEPLDTQTEAVAVADRLVQAVAEPIPVSAGRRVQIGASIGIALSQAGTSDPELLLHEADVAVRRAKAYGGGRREVFDAALRQELSGRSAVERGMNDALANHDFELRYTPVLELISGEIRWFTAAVHWQRGRELIPPEGFLPVAGQLDLISEIDAWALAEVTRRLGMWRSRSDVGISLTLSARRLGMPGLGAEVGRALSAARVPAERLIIDVPETALVENPVIRTNLSDLHELGVVLAVSGFGAGSSLDSRLATLALDLARIDCRRPGPDAQENDDRLVRLLVQTAHAFGLRVVADRVSSTAQLARVERLGCAAAQGPAVGAELDALGATASLEHAWSSPL